MATINLDEINAGGVNGSGKGTVDTKHKDHKLMREKILAESSAQSLEERIHYALYALQIQMKSYLLNDAPSELIQVGDFLKFYLQAVGVNKQYFANYVEVEETNLTAILQGNSNISVDFAFKLGHLFDMDANLWLLLQNKNDLLSIKKEQQLSYEKYRLADLLKKAG